MTVSMPIARRLTKCLAADELVPGYCALYLCDETGGQILYDHSGNGYNGQLGTTAGVDLDDPAQTPLGLRFVADSANISAALAGFAGSTGFTAQIVASAAVSVPFAGILAGFAGTDAQKTLIILDSTNGSGDADSIYINIVDGAGTFAANSVPGRLGPTPSLITVRLAGGTVLESRKDAGAWVRQISGVPTRIGLAPIDAGAKLYLGKYFTYNHIGATSLAVFYPVALTDAQLAHNDTAIAAILARRGMAIGAALPSYPNALALGDSITLGVGISGVTAGTTYPYALQQQLGYCVENAGIGGNTTTQMLARLPGLLAQTTPTSVLIMGGTNDVSLGVPSATIIANLEDMIEAVAPTGARVVLLTIPPSSVYGAPDSAKNVILNEANAWIATQASNGVIVADTHAALKDPATPTQLLAAYDSGDHLHPSAAGLRIIADTVYAAIPGA